jgi:hypothetical protein
MHAETDWKKLLDQVASLTRELAEAREQMAEIDGGFVPLKAFYDLRKQRDDLDIELGRVGAQRDEAIAALRELVAFAGVTRSLPAYIEARRILAKHGKPHGAEKE